jgi:hypothetical protein
MCGLRDKSCTSKTYTLKIGDLKVRFTLKLYLEAPPPWFLLDTILDVCIKDVCARNKLRSRARSLLEKWIFRQKVRPQLSKGLENPSQRRTKSERLFFIKIKTPEIPTETFENIHTRGGLFLVCWPKNTQSGSTFTSIRLATSGKSTHNPHVSTS